jgi:pimeloyl-ACP methyl ester carboxylesterase
MVAFSLSLPAATGFLDLCDCKLLLVDVTGKPQNHRVSEYLLVHGGFGVGWVWDDVARRLEMAGHRVHVLDQLPSVGTDSASLGDLSADAQAPCSPGLLLASREQDNRTPRDEMHCGASQLATFSW